MEPFHHPFTSAAPSPLILQIVMRRWGSPHHRHHLMSDDNTSVVLICPLCLVLHCWVSDSHHLAKTIVSLILIIGTVDPCSHLPHNLTSDDDPRVVLIWPLLEVRISDWHHLPKAIFIVGSVRRGRPSLPSNPDLNLSSGEPLIPPPHNTRAPSQPKVYWLREQRL